MPRRLASAAPLRYRRPMSLHRPLKRWSPRSSALAALTTITLLAAPDSAPAFDTGPHSDITRDALTAEGFGATAADVVVVNNWFVDLYSNSSKIPQSGHADTAVSVLGAIFENDEHWSQGVLDAANRMHFDASIWDVTNVGKAEIEWDRLQRATTQLLGTIKSVNGPNKEIQVLSTIGMGLHAIQDFYSHSNWIEDRSVEGTDGTDWSALNYGLTPTWFDVPKERRDGLNVYIGESSEHKTRKHGAWNTEGNKKMSLGVNKDWPGRPGYVNAYMTAYFATRQWVQAIHIALGDEALWQRTIRYANRGGGELDHDLKGALGIGMMTGHWQGQGEPCDPGFSLNICGSRNGLGGDLIGARSAVNSYFEDRDRTRFRGAFQGLLPLYGQPAPNGGLLSITSSRSMQATTRFVQMRVTSMKGVGLRALGDPTLADRADMFSRATIAGQSFQSGEINGRDSFSFGLPYAPFTFIKAIAPGARYAEPVTTMTVEIRTSSKTFAGTDDDVYLRVSPTLRFPLDKSLYDDFERGDRDTYSVPIDAAVLAGLKVGDISRVQIEKSPDGAAGGWRLRGVKLVVNGRTLYSRDGIERWLEDDHRTWRAPDFTQTAPSGTALSITLDLWDEDSNIYGGDDHGDLNRYDNRRRLALAYVPETVAGTRATGGSYLSGRIGDGDKASVTYTIETLTPTPAPLRPIPPVPPQVLEPASTPVTPVADPPAPPPPPAPKPDLVISAMGYDETLKYFFTVTNQGGGTAGAFTVDVSGEGTFPIDGLAPGASTTRTFRTTCRQTTWDAVADPLAQVAETDETNNTRSLSEICLL
jgi:hypothetical protein